MQEIGELSKWLDEKGYGFVRPSRGGADVFVHSRDFPFHQRRPREGDRIRYKASKDDQGRLRAVNPKILGFTASAGAWIAILLWLASASFAGLVYVQSVPLTDSTMLVGLYLFGSTLAFSAYFWDKHRAVAGGSRIPEATLHALELFGGWPGALLAQRMFRHKVRKTSYQVIFWIIVAVHAALWIMLARG